MNQFILIDDDPVSNFITKRHLLTVFPHAEIKEFTDNEEGLEYVKHIAAHPNSCTNTVLLLDLNMPALSGIEFISELEGQRGFLKDRMKVFILTSSVHPHDAKLVSKTPSVNKLLTKPITEEKIYTSILPHMNIGGISAITLQYN